MATQPAWLKAPQRGWQPPSLRALGLYWLVVLLVFGGGAATLAILGPPEEPVQQAAAPAAPPAPAPAPSVPAPPAPPPAAEAPPPGPVSPAERPSTPPSTPAADQALLQPGPYGPLPRLGPDGRSPMRAYARPFDRAEMRPRVGLVLGGLGMNRALTEEAIRRLPPGITLAFSPYAAQPALLLDQARARGMELLVALPLEPTGYPLNSPGDRALLTGLSPTDNQDRLDWVLSRFSGYVGAIGALGPMRGERFAALTERLGTLEETLRGRGLLYVDPRPGASAQMRSWGRVVDVVVDDPPTRLDIDRKLAALEDVARERGSALGYAGEATPVLLDRLASWAGSLESRGNVLAPVSALARRPEGTAAAEPRP